MDLGTTEPALRRPVEKSVEMLAIRLPAKGGTIYWEAFDVPEFFEQLSGFMSRREQERIALHLMGFYYWLSVQQLASPENVAEILDELADYFPESGTVILLHQCAMIGLAGGIDAVLADCRSASGHFLQN